MTTRRADPQQNPRAIRGVPSIRVAALALLCGLTVAVHPAVSEAQTAPPCSVEAHRHFDFWEGRWVVRAATGALAGHSTITVSLGACVLREHYTTPSGYEGRSLNAYDASRDVWHQTWVDNGGLVLVLEGGYEDGRMIMQGETTSTDGSVSQNRITWSRVDDDPDRVRQLWETSPDGGAAWTTAFDGLYIRQSSSADYDLLLQGGTVVNGSGGAGFPADVAVRDDRIVRISPTPLDPTRAARVIDASGKVVSPGFVDIHTHLDPLLRLPGAESHVRQGVTTALGGPDGGSPWPLDTYFDEAQAAGLGEQLGGVWRRSAAEGLQPGSQRVEVGDQPAGASDLSSARVGLDGASVSSVSDKEQSEDHRAAQESDADG